jgi:hypothetical protein
MVELDNLTRIIELCSNNKVHKLKLGGLSIVFHPQSENTPIDQRLRSSQELFSDQVEREAAASQRMLDDPLGYEQDEIDRHLRGDNVGASINDRQDQLLV